MGRVNASILFYMKCVATLVLVHLTLTANVLAANRPTVRRDTYFPVILQTKVNTENAQVGDEVILLTTEGVLIGNNVVVPKGAEVVGAIDEVQQSGRDTPDSTLVIRFRSVRWREGEANLNAVVASVEVTTQSEKLIFRHIHNLFSRPTMLEQVEVYAHVERKAFTEFRSRGPHFVLRPGIRLVLRQIDPDREHDTMVKNLVLDVNQSWKN